MTGDKLSAVASVSLEFCVSTLVITALCDLLTVCLGWAGGVLGIYLARNNQRNVMPSIMSAVSIYVMFSWDITALF